VLYNRQLALFNADHDLKAEVSICYACGEYAVRRDIYGADAVAWTALKQATAEARKRPIKRAAQVRKTQALYHAG